MNPFWFEFILKGHEARKNENKIIKFSIDGKKFELTFANRWYTLYRITTNSRTMLGSEFYTLGVKDVHTMADTGLQHLNKGS